MKQKYIIFDIETTGLRAYESIITCICAKDSEGNIFKLSLADGDEFNIISNFIYWIQKKEDYILISANGRDFDIPFILQRCACLKLTPSFLDYFLQLKQFDIINDITSHRISLNNLAKLYGFPEKSNSGFGAIQMYEREDYKALVGYCFNDVELTEKIYLKYLELQNGTGKA